jgi:hypothetical protein
MADDLTVRHPNESYIFQGKPHTYGIIISVREVDDLDTTISFQLMVSGEYALNHMGMV